MMKANEGRVCDGSLGSSEPGEGEGEAREGPSPLGDAVRGIARERSSSDEMEM